MRSKHLCITVILFVSLQAAQSQNLDHFNEDRLKMTKKGMLVLGSWATANMIASPILAHRSSGCEKYFHQMNGYWNGVNFMIAGFGYLNVRKMSNRRFSMIESLKEQQKLEKTLLFNTGLDVAYMVSGLYLIERSKNEISNSERFEGFGQSLVLQGGFLFAFDLIFYLTQKKHGEKLFSIVEKLALYPSSFRIVWQI